MSKSISSSLERATMKFRSMSTARDGRNGKDSLATAEPVSTVKVKSMPGSWGSKPENDLKSVPSFWGKR